jgi:hypothetical protein
MATVKTLAAPASDRRVWLVASLAIGTAVVIVLGPLLLALFLVATVFTPESASASGGDQSCATSGYVTGSGSAADVGSLDAEQVHNAAVIIAVAKQHKVPEYGWVVALATALQESSLHNYPGGDADSAGLFQQRPSQGWGTHAQVANPVLATEAFFGVASYTNNTGLLDVHGWENMPVTVAAQTVQKSLYPDAYADNEAMARSLVAKLAGVHLTAGTPLTCGDGTAMDCPPTTSPAENGLTPDALRVLRCVQQQFGDHTYLGVGPRSENPNSDHPTGRAVDIMIAHWQTPTGKAEGWRIAHWVRAHAPQLGVKYVIFDAKIWSTDRSAEGWRPYAHPSGLSSPTLDHLNHVHVSVFGNAASDDSASGTYVLPVPAGSYQLTARFGDCSTLWAACHTGLDFATYAGAGVAIHAVTDGTIVSTTPYCGSPSACPYGNVTLMRISPTTTLMYAHQLRFAAGIHAGSHVHAGEVIGFVGSTGNTTGPHLHFEVRVNDQPIDPEPWLEGHGLSP